MKKIIWGGILSWLFLAVLERPVLAADPHFFLSPASGSFSQGFTIDIKVDSGGQAVGGADVYLEFPKAILKIESVVKGTIFPEVYSLIKNEEGKLRLNGYYPIAQSGESYNGTDGLLAKINFTPLGAGTAEVKFICSAGATNDSNIVEKTTVKDIIVCSANVNGSYTISTGGGPTSTPAPTATPTSTSGGGTAATATPTLPVSGLPIFSNLFLGAGLMSLLLGLGFLIF